MKAEGVDARKLSVMVLNVFAFVRLEVPAFYHLVLTTRDEIRTINPRTVDI